MQHFHSSFLKDKKPDMNDQEQLPAPNLQLDQDLTVAFPVNTKHPYSCNQLYYISI